MIHDDQRYLQKLARKQRGGSLFCYCGQNEITGHLFKDYRSIRVHNFAKKYNAKCVRQYKGHIPNGNKYRRYGKIDIGMIL